MLRKHGAAGMLTENIFDCFLMGTIPINLGPPDVTDYIPEDCFIDPRRFGSHEELPSFLKSHGPAEIKRYRENARDYWTSEKFAPFTKEHLAQPFTRAAEQDTGIPLRQRL